MKKFFILSLVAGTSLQIGRMLESDSRLAAAGGGQGGEAEVCATKNGDVNADLNVELSDAVTILNHLFLGHPTKLAGLCDTPKLEACQAELAAKSARIQGLETQLANCRAGMRLGLPDTGQTKCYEESTELGLPCDSVSCPGQDGSYATGCPQENRFTDNGDGTVTDHCTGLMWQKDSGNDGQPVTWCEAVTYCQNLILGVDLVPLDDWRLPNLLELQSIVDYGRVNPAINPVFNALSEFYWSSTSSNFSPSGAWHVYFYGGFVHFDLKAGNGGENPFYYVRAVRGGF